MENGFLKVFVLVLLCAPVLQAQEPLRVGTIIHSTGPLAASSQQSQAALKAYFDELNSLGGTNGRKLELIVATVEPSDIQRVIDQKVIAFVGGAIAGHEKPIGDLIRAAKVPLIGPATLVPPVGPPLNPYGFYLMPGIKEQATALVNFAAAKPELKNAPAAIVYFEGELNAFGSAAAEEHAIRVGWKGVAKSVHRYGDFESAVLAQGLKQKRTQTVFFFGAPAQLKQLMQASEAAGITPTFLTIGAFAGADLSGTVTPAFKDKFFLSFPTIPADITEAGNLRSMREKYKLAATHLAMQLATFAAARVFTVALIRSGTPTRAALVTSLEQLKDYETGYSPRVTFTKTRRIGAAGANIIAYDPASKNLVPLGWTPAY